MPAAAELLTVAEVAHRLRQSQDTERGVKGELPAHAVFALIRADAEHYASVSTREQAALMRGVSTAELTGDEAMWAGSDADLARRKREKEKLIASGGQVVVDALKLEEARRSGVAPFGSSEGS
jgi:hypothetical protein